MRYFYFLNCTLGKPLSSVGAGGKLLFPRYLGQGDVMIDSRSLCAALAARYVRLF